MKKILIAIAFFICVVLLISILVFLEVRRQQSRDLVEQGQETAIQAETTDQVADTNFETENWNSCKNEEYNYEISYPENWNISLPPYYDILTECKKVNHSLPLILENSFPMNLAGDVLKLAFEFEIHYKKMAEKICLERLEKILVDIFSQKITVKPIILSHEEFQKIKGEIDDNQINQIAEIFGGKVIE